MTPKPQPRTAQRSVQERTVAPRSGAAAQPRGTSAPIRPGTRPAQGAPRLQARTGTDEFARLMRQNTVDVEATAGRRRRSPVVGKIGLGLAVVCVAVDASAFAVFMGGEQGFAFGICFVVVFLTFIAAVMGFIAAVGSMGRWYGVIGVVVAFFANPVVLIVLTVFVAPELVNTMGSPGPQ